MNIATWETLETVTVKLWLRTEAMRTVMSMPRLKILRLMDNYDPAEFTNTAAVLPKNHSVTNLHIKQSDYNFDWFKYLIEAFSNLESLSVNVLSDENCGSHSRNMQEPQTTFCL